MEKPNIRIQFTQKALRDSLITLMKEKSILKISIKEICGLAGLSRSTFYTYYKDQYDLLRHIEEQTFIDIGKIIQQRQKPAKKFSRQDGTAEMREILQYIANNSNSIQILLSENGDSGFQKKFFYKSVEGMGQFMDTMTVTKSWDKKMAEYGYFFLVGGSLTLIQTWLKNGLDTPVPEMAKLLIKLIWDALS